MPPAWSSIPHVFLGKTRFKIKRGRSCVPGVTHTHTHTSLPEYLPVALSHESPVGHHKCGSSFFTLVFLNENTSLPYANKVRMNKCFRSPGALAGYWSLGFRLNSCASLLRAPMPEAPQGQSVGGIHISPHTSHRTRG